MHGTVHLFDRLPQVTRPAAPPAGAAAPVRQVPLVGVIRNLRSHRQAAALPDWSGRAHLLVETPAERSELQDVLGGIVLLGLKVSIMDVLGLGWLALVLIVGVVAASFGGTYLISRLFRLPPVTSLLVATGFSICGASAIGAMAAVRRIRHVDTVLPVALVTLCGTLAIGVLPLLVHPLQLSAPVFGAWTGASVHDVGQVVATAQTAGTAALGIAVVVKLTRVLLLAPVAALAGAHHRYAPRPEYQADGDNAKLPPVVPLFVLGFMAMVGLRSTGWLDAGWLEAGAALQDVLLGAALFGLGSAVRIRTLLHTGGRALLAALASWFLIALLGLAAALLIAG